MLIQRSSELQVSSEMVCFGMILWKKKKKKERKEKKINVKMLRKW